MREISDTKRRKRILVLTGSPRSNGNSSEMANVFRKRAETEGHRVCQINTAQMKVTGCDACELCFQNGEPCRIEDGFNKIAIELEKADVIVFVTPVYWYSVPAQLKAVIDKMYAYLVCGRCNCIMDKECMLIACCEDSEADVFGGVRFIYEHIAKQLNWCSLGEVLIPGVLNEGDIKRTEGEKLAAQLVDQL